MLVPGDWQEWQVRFSSGIVFVPGSTPAILHAAESDSGFSQFLQTQVNEKSLRVTPGTTLKSKKSPKGQTSWLVSGFLNKVFNLRNQYNDLILHFGRSDLEFDFSTGFRKSYSYSTEELKTFLLMSLSMW